MIQLNQTNIIKRLVCLGKLQKAITLCHRMQTAPVKGSTYQYQIRTNLEQESMWTKPHGEIQPIITARWNKKLGISKWKLGKLDVPQLRGNCEVCFRQRLQVVTSATSQNHRILVKYQEMTLTFELENLIRSSATHSNCAYVFLPKSATLFLKYHSNGVSWQVSRNDLDLHNLIRSSTANSDCVKKFWP